MNTESSFYTVRRAIDFSMKFPSAKGSWGHRSFGENKFFSENNKLGLNRVEAVTKTRVYASEEEFCVVRLEKSQKVVRR